jgi:predicted DNA-binding ribbon-helix-helix protein
MNPTNIKRSIVRNGQKTSVSLEQEFWEALREIASSQNTKLTTLVQKIDAGRVGTNLSSAIRVFVFNHQRAQLAGAQVRLIEAEKTKDHTSGERSRPITGSTVYNTLRR